MTSEQFQSAKRLFVESMLGDFDEGPCAGKMHASLTANASINDALAVATRFVALAIETGAYLTMNVYERVDAPPIYSLHLLAVTEGTCPACGAVHA